MLTVVRASVAGGIVAKAYGIGFELEAAAEFMWVRPQPDILAGKIKITLDLPWPIPNLHYTLDISDGTDEPTEDLQTLIDGLTLIPRQPSGVIELEGGPNQALVPVDPVFALAFSYPTRNGATVDGNFQIISAGLHAVDMTVTHETSGGNAYAIELTAIRLWRGAVGTGTLHPGPIPAKWVKQPTDARRRPAVAPGAGTVLSRGHRTVAPGRPDRRARRRSRRRVEPLPASVGTKADLLFLGRSAARTDADDGGDYFARVAELECHRARRTGGRRTDAPLSSAGVPSRRRSCRSR